MDPAPAMYLIRINGHLGATVLSAFPGLIPRQHGAHTVLTGLLDQSALYGVLGEIEALGLDLLEVRQLSREVLGAVTRRRARTGGNGPSRKAACGSRRRALWAGQA
jgi:hypothetical protein